MSQYTKKLELFNSSNLNNNCLAGVRGMLRHFVAFIQASFSALLLVFEPRFGVLLSNPQTVAQFQALRNKNQTSKS